jgi:hypothetical protein
VTLASPGDAVPRLALVVPELDFCLLESVGGVDANRQA